MEVNGFIGKRENRKRKGLPEIAAVAPPVRRPLVGSRYQIVDGRYKGRTCKVVKLVGTTDKPFAEVIQLDGWGKETKERDIIPHRNIGF